MVLHLKNLLSFLQKNKKKYKTVISHLEIDLPDHPMSYTAMPNAVKGKGIWAASGINEKILR